MFADQVGEVFDIERGAGPGDVVEQDVGEWHVVTRRDGARVGVAHCGGLLPEGAQRARGTNRGCHGDLRRSSSEKQPKRGTRKTAPHCLRRVPPGSPHYDIMRPASHLLAQVVGLAAV